MHHYILQEKTYFIETMSGALGNEGIRITGFKINVGVMFPPPGNGIPVIPFSSSESEVVSIPLTRKFSSITFQLLHVVVIIEASLSTISYSSIHSLVSSCALVLSIALPSFFFSLWITKSLHSAVRASLFGGHKCQSNHPGLFTHSFTNSSMYFSVHSG